MLWPSCFWQEYPEMNQEEIQSSRNLNDETQGRQGKEKPVFKFEQHSLGNL